MTEIVLLAMACLAPWAFGAVEAWAELGLYFGVALLGLLGAMSERGSVPGRYLLCGPSLALVGLALLGGLQSATLPHGVLGWADPEAARERRALVPGSAEKVVGEPGPDVARPRPTLGQDPEASFDTAARLLAAWIVFQAALRAGGVPAFRRFSLVVSVNAAAMALFATIQVLSWNGKIYWTFPSPSVAGGPFVCHSHLAAYLNLGLGLALGLAWASCGSNTRDAGLRLGLHYAAAVMIIGIITSLSRNGFLGLGAGLAIAAFLQRSRARVLMVTLATFALAIPVLLASLRGESPYRERLLSLLDAGQYQIRLRIWQDVARAWRAHPAWGIGLGGFPVAAARYVEVSGKLFFAHGENECVEWLVEGGLVGSGLCLLGAFGVARLGQRALRGARAPGDRALAIGASFGLTALLVETFGDFAPHIPGVAVLAVAVCGHLCRLGLDASARTTDPGAIAGEGRVPLVNAAAALLGACLLLHGVHRARAEGALAEVDVPIPGRAMPSVGLGRAFRATLEARRVALERALRHRPDWAEGHLRLGKAYLALYRADTAALIAADLKDSDATRLADPLKLHEVVHSAPAEAPVTASSLLEYAPVRRWLVPAAREFLEARRCSPHLALAHVEIAGLDFLLTGGDSSTAYAGRALRLAGADDALIRRVAKLALQCGDTDLAARAWRRSLEIDPKGWERVADSACAVLTPDQVLRDVLPHGARFPFLFAQRLRDAPERREHRRRFLREVVERSPLDSTLAEPEQSWLEGEAWAELGEPARARARMSDALRGEPFRSEWRYALVGRLIGWGDPDEAQRQAKIGLQLAPGDAAMRGAWEEATKASIIGTSASRIEPAGPR